MTHTHWHVLTSCAAIIAGVALPADYASALPPEPLYVVIMTHAEGDFGELEGSPTCPAALVYQTLAAPPVGQPLPGPLFAVDIAGTDLLREILANYHDSLGGEAKLFIEPAGEFWQTEAHATYGGKLFQTYDYQALGYELGIQGHAIYYSGTNFCSAIDLNELQQMDTLGVRVIPELLSVNPIYGTSFER